MTQNGLFWSSLRPILRYGTQIITSLVWEQTLGTCLALKKSQKWRCDAKSVRLETLEGNGTSPLEALYGNGAYGVPTEPPFCKARNGRVDKTTHEMDDRSHEILRDRAWVRVGMRTTL